MNPASIYSSDLETTKDFYSKIGLEFTSEEEGRHVFPKAGKSMLLIFNPENTRIEGNSRFPIHGAIVPPASIHVALEIEKEDIKIQKRC